MVERRFWQSLGGMDELLAVVMNDVDICLRSQMEGRYVLYTPNVRLLHHVGSSRGTSTLSMTATASSGDGISLARSSTPISLSLSFSWARRCTSSFDDPGTFARATLVA